MFYLMGKDKITHIWDSDAPLSATDVTMCGIALDRLSTIVKRWPGKNPNMCMACLKKVEHQNMLDK